jgi:hypothetical protein
MSRLQFHQLMKSSIVFQATEHAQYNEKRKNLSAAFFKQKLLGMT